MFSPDELSAFARDGYIIVRGLLPDAVRERMLDIAKADLAEENGPVEYEADVHYPGSPISREETGGRTIRRLLQASERGAMFRDWATGPALAGHLHQLLGPEVLLVRAHHNCIMTKQPRFSSDTLWHRDIRYWSYTHPDLVSVWLALGPESADNGCLRVLPGSHRWALSADQFDARTFLRTDLSRNQPLLAQAVPVLLAPGDVLFFHAQTFHAADRNRSMHTKFSPVFTYRAASNLPVSGSRSAAFSDIRLP